MANKAVKHFILTRQNHCAAHRNGPDEAFENHDNMKFRDSRTIHVVQVQRTDTSTHTNTHTDTQK